MNILSAVLLSIPLLFAPLGFMYLLGSSSKSLMITVIIRNFFSPFAFYYPLAPFAVLILASKQQQKKKNVCI